jgi:hypothetical protein
MGKPSSRSAKASGDKSAAAARHKNTKARASVPKSNKGSLKVARQKGKAVAGGFVQSCGITAAGLSSLLQSAFEDLADANIKVQVGQAPKAKRETRLGAWPAPPAPHVSGIIKCETLPSKDLEEPPMQPPHLHESASIRIHGETSRRQPNLLSMMDGFKL